MKTDFLNSDVLVVWALFELKKGSMTNKLFISVQGKDNVA